MNIYDLLTLKNKSDILNLAVGAMPAGSVKNVSLDPTGILATVASNSVALAEKANSSDLGITNANVTNGLALKTNKTDLIPLASFAQDAKTAMTGGSVAVIGKRGTLKDNLAISLYQNVLPLKYFALQNQTYSNLLDYNSFDATQYYNNSGALIPGGGYGNYGFTAVLPSTKYIGNATNQYICYYDNTQTFISGIVGANSFTTPSNCTYVRISRITTGTTTTSPILITGNTLITPLDFLEGDGKYLIPSANFNLQEFETFFSNYFAPTLNLLDTSIATAGYYVSNTNGVLAGGTGYHASGYIVVTAGLTYNYGINTSVVNGQQMAWYDVNKVFISGVSTAPNMTAPVGACYARITVQDTRLLTLMFFLGSLPTSYVPFGFAIKPSVLLNYALNRNSNLILYTIGDSLTYMGYWQPEVQERLGLSSVVNLGIGGSTIIQSANTMLSELTNLTTSANIITVWGGTNDYGGALPLGLITDTTTATFYGALYSIINTISTSYPSAKLLFITPLQRFDKLGVNSVGSTLEDYANAIIAVCKLYSIPCLDLQHEGGINTFNQANYLADQLHINPGNGAQLIAPKIFSKIASLI